MAQASRALVRAGVFADVVDVGGGFPSVYPGMIPPDLGEYVAAIDRGFAEMMVHETTELWCEPGRALVAEGSSLLTRVELRKGDALYLNDGSYGALFDAAHAKWPFPVKLHRADGVAAERPEAVPLLRADLRLARRHAGPVLAAGGRAPRATTSRSACWAPTASRMSTRFNGFGDIETVRGRTTRRCSRCSASPRARSRPRAPRPRTSSSCRGRVAGSAGSAKPLFPLIPAKAADQQDVDRIAFASLALRSLADSAPSAAGPGFRRDERRSLERSDERSHPQHQGRAARPRPSSTSTSPPSTRGR